MSSVADELSPNYYGEDRIDLSLADQPPPQAESPVLVDVSYARCLPEGIVLPLELVVVGPSGRATSQRIFFRRTKPAQVTFRPIEGGPTLIRLAELYHHRWFGALVIDVAGNPLDRT